MAKCKEYINSVQGGIINMKVSKNEGLGQCADEMNGRQICEGKGSNRVLLQSETITVWDADYEE